MDSTIQHLNNRSLFNRRKVRDSDPSWHHSSEVTGTGEGGKAMGIKYSAVASMRPTEALASVKFWRISPIIFILHKRSSEPLRKDFVAKI